MRTRIITAALAIAALAGGSLALGRPEVIPGCFEDGTCSYAAGSHADASERRIVVCLPGGQLCQEQ